MITFVIEYWWQVAVYLVGCVLAYGRINAQCINDKDSKESIAIIWLLTILSWYGFAWGLGMRDGAAKWFKWLPVLLLSILFSAGCKNEPYKYQCLSTDGTSHGSYIQYPKGTRINWGSGDPAWMIDSCYEFVINDNALK